MKGENKTKMENIILRDSFKEYLKGLKEEDLNIYLKNGLELDKESILKAMAYFKSYLPKELKQIILNDSYWNLYYNSDLSKFIINQLKVNEEYKKAVETFVYTFNDVKRDFYKEEDENNLKNELLKQGFKEQFVLKNINGKMVFLNEELKLLHNLKVLCVFDRDKIGLLGSYTAKEQHEGKLFFDEKQNKLFFLPKRHTRTGQILINKFYYKEI